MTNADEHGAGRTGARSARRRSVPAYSATPYAHLGDCVQAGDYAFAHDERPRSPRCLGPAHHAVRRGGRGRRRARSSGLCGEYLARRRAPASSRSARPASRARSTPTRSKPSSTRARACASAASTRADRRHRHEQHARTIAATAGARGRPGGRRRARRRAVLRAAVGSRHRRALPRGRRGEPGPDRRLQHPVAHRSRPRRRRRCSSSPRRRTSRA